MRAASSSCCSGAALERQQGASVPGRQHAGRHPALHRDRQPQQPDHVGDEGAGPTDAGREFIVGDAELVEQLLIGGRLFQRVQLRAVDVLQQGVAQHAVVGGLADDRRDGRQPGLLRGAPPPLPHDELVPRRRRARHRADHDRLHQAELADRVHELGECLFVEHLARLPRVRVRSPTGRSRGRPRRRRFGSRRARRGRRRRPRRPSAFRRVATGRLRPGPVGMSDARPRPRPLRLRVGWVISVSSCGSSGCSSFAHAAHRRWSCLRAGAHRVRRVSRLASR